MEEKKYYTITEVSMWMNCHKNSVLKLIDEGKLKAVNLGRGKKNMWRISAEAIDNFMAS